ncbi:Cytochrome P450 [Rhynchospora pubera]|uniref:Cytochrome P450 n=1 Tax=Rhynchospora pubera TaxID=906938 RepID=A0AAV8C5U4_9POAL|nr:Cytochrome P450 [Rhynchospora pubera]
MELLFLSSTFLLVCLPLLLYLFFLKNEDPTKKSSMYGIKPYPILGYVPHFIKNRHRVLDWCTEILIPSPTHTMGFATFGENGGVITANPKNVEHIVKTNFNNYPKGELMIFMLVDFFGHGIFNSDGEQWLWQRKAASLEFSKRSLRNFVVSTVQTEIVNRLLPLLNKLEETNQTIDLQDLLERFAVDNICNVAFGEDPACLTEDGYIGEKSKFMKDFGEAQEITLARFMNPLRFVWRVKKFLNIGSERRLKELISTVHGYTMNIVKAKKERALIDQKQDLLSRFFSNNECSDESLCDVVTNFILAGRETTSSALTWFFWLVSTQPNVEEKIIEEIKSVRIKNQVTSEVFDYDDLREMNYLHSAITESMRLYPPVAMDSATCKEDDILPDGTFVGKGWFISYCAYAMGRIEDIWGHDCNEFKPERWLENGIFKPENPFKYPVFHGGPRMCLGKEMAYIQMKSIAACVFERFKVKVVGMEGTPETLLSFTLRMKGGLPIQLSKRKNIDQ